KTSELIRDNSNALTEVDAETSLARFPVHRCGVRVGCRPTCPHPTGALSVGARPCVHERATASAAISEGRKPSSKRDSCAAHGDARLDRSQVENSVFRGVELGARE